jgi:hypothetical protein
VKLGLERNTLNFSIVVANGSGAAGEAPTHGTRITPPASLTDQAGY